MSDYIKFWLAKEMSQVLTVVFILLALAGLYGSLIAFFWAQERITKWRRGGSSGKG